MAAVWLARLRGKHGFEKLVVVKTILPIYASDPQFRRMFLDEATIASRIEHNHVAQILDLREHDGVLYLVMEWVEGDSVARLDRAVRHAGRVIPQEMALRIVSDACAGLQAAHELCDAAGNSLSVVHRDVSPQNILISSKGVVKVIDFGIAKARDRAVEETRSGVFKGKLHYMAPEQATGRTLDVRADVWAVAAVLYRLLSGRHVYEGANRVDIFNSLTRHAAISALPAQVPARLSSIVFKALSFDPAGRHESCAELHEELDAVVRAGALYCSPSELGAFVNGHLGERFEVRRQTIAQSIQALDAQPALSSATGASMLVTFEAALPPKALPSAPLASDGPLDQLSGRARHWAQANSENSFTVGSASVDARPPTVRSRVNSRIRIVAFVAVSALAATLLFWQHAASRATPAPASGRADGEISRVATSAAHASSLPSASARGTPGPVVIAVESLPLTNAAEAPLKRKLRVAAPSVQPKPKRRIVDDGF